MNEMYDKLVDLLTNHFAVDPADIRPDATFEELKMDSLFLVELLLVAQSEFDIKISEDAATPNDTISQVAELIGHQVRVSAQ